MIRLNRSGLSKVLKSDEVREALHGIADAIAGEAELNPLVEHYGAEIVVEDYETDRAAVAVGLSHPGGAGIEAKYRILQQAARDQGFAVDEGLGEL